MPDSSAERNPVEVLAEEFVARCRRGERPALSEYIQRYPQYADEIREVFPALVMLEQFKPAAQDHTGAYDGSTQEPTRPLQRLGDYHILREVGRGGMGVVYEAEQLSLGRHVALKVLPAHALLNPTFLERFQREARAAARLHHTNIVPVFGVGEHQGVHFYAMQFIQGEALDRVLRDLRRFRTGAVGPAVAEAPHEGTVAHSLLTGHCTMPAVPGPAPPGAPSEASAATSRIEGQSANLSAGGSGLSYYRSVARIGLQVAEALAYAHRQGVLHRDIKPSNLLLDLQGTVWITDFGLAKAEGSDELTHTGDIVGTLRFMAPERFDGHSLPQSDVYGLGVTLYELLTLKPAFADSNKARLIDKVLHEPPVPPRRLEPAVPRDLETVVLKCLAKSPAERYAGADALADDLRRFLADRPIRARRTPWHERTWRWCRRNPAVAGLLGAVGLLVLAVAVISTVAALELKSALDRSENERQEADAQRKRAEAAERDQKRQVYQGHVTEANYRRFSRRHGQRFASLAALRKALRLLPDLGMSEQEQEEQRYLLRRLAISCLTLPDVRTVKEWQGWTEGCRGLDLDERGRLYARVDHQGNASIRRIADDHEVFRIAGDGKPGWFDFTPVDGLVIAWRSSNKVEGWRLGERRPAFVLQEAGPPARFRVARNGRMLATALRDGTITVYDLPDGTIRRREREPASDDPVLEFSPDGRYLAVVGGRYRQPARSLLHLYDLTSRQPPPTFTHPDSIHTIAWYPDGRAIAAGGWNEGNEICVWDVPSGRRLPAFTSQKGGGPLVSINRTGDLLASTSSWAHGVRLWHAQTGQELLTLSSVQDHFALAAPDGRLLALNREGTKVRLAECVPGQAHRTLVRDLRAERGKRYTTPTLHPGGRLLAVSMETGVGLWDLPTGRELAFLPLGRTETVVFESSGALWTYGHAGMLRWPVRLAGGTSQKCEVGPPQTVLATSIFGLSMAISRDGRVAAASLGPGLAGAFVFHRDHPHRPVRLGPHEDVRFVAVSPDGRYVATRANGPHGVKVWQADTGKLLAHLFRTQKAWGAFFTPDGRWLVIDADWFEVGTWQRGKGLEGGAAVGWVSGDGKWLASGGEGVRLYDRETGRRLVQLGSPEQGRIWWMTFNHDGTQMIVTDQDNLLLHVWDLRKLRGELQELGLDWDAPPYPPAPPAEHSSGAPRLQVNLGDVEDNVVLGPQPTPAHLRQVIERNSLLLAFQPFNFKLYRQRGRAHGRLGEAGPAIADYSRALLLMPAGDLNRADLLGRRAGNHLVLREHDRALADLREAERIDPVRAAGFRYYHALFLLRRAAQAATTERPAALLDLRKAAEIDPGSALAHNNLAWFLLTGPREAGQVKEALGHARRAVALAGDNRAFVNTLGVALYRNDQFADAVKLLKAGPGENSPGALDLYCLALCHARLGDRTKAKECFDRAVAWQSKNRDLGPRQVEELKAFRAEAEKVLRLR